MHLGSRLIGPAHAFAGILGENLILPPSITQTVLNFAVVNGVTLAFCLLVFASIMGYIRYRRLM